MKSQKHIEWDLANYKFFLESDPHDEYLQGRRDSLINVLTEPRLVKCKCGKENDYFDLGDAGFAECECGWIYKSASGMGLWEFTEKTK